MRILFVANTNADPNQGAPGCDLAINGALRGLGHEVDEVWLGQVPRRLAHPNLHQLLELPGRYSRVVAQHCKSANYDVIQVNQPHAYLAARHHRRERRPGVFINRSHGWEPAARETIAAFRVSAADNRPIWRRAATHVMAWLLERHNSLVLRYSDGVVVCSVDDRDYILNARPRLGDRIVALAPGISPDYLAEPPSVQVDRFRRLLHVGSFSPHKAPEVVALIARMVLEQDESLTMTWVADNASHAAIGRMLGPSANRVALRGWMSRQELRGLFDQHGLFLFPSHFEGFALTFLEAMARGLCVFGTRIDGMRQVIRDGIDGFLFDRGEVDAVAARLLRIAANLSECVRISQEARKTSLKYTWERTAREYVEFCQTLAHAKAS